MKTKTSRPFYLFSFAVSTVPLLFFVGCRSLGGAGDGGAAAEARSEESTGRDVPAGHGERGAAPVRSDELAAGAVSEDTSAVESPRPPVSPVVWERRFQGVDSGVLQIETPRLMRGVCVRVDLNAPGVAFLTTPPNGDRPGETDGLKTSTFLRETGCQVAINAAPFSPINHFEKRQQDVVGYHVSAGEVVSPPGRGRPALLISRSNRATIAGPPFPDDDVWNAVAGFGRVLEDGEIAGREAPLHPRTAAGISRDGRFLYLLVIDGRQPGHSEGAATADVGRVLKSLGAWDGINLDGGGTSTMVIEDPSGKPQVLNRTIHAGIPGLERISASHLGVKAAPLVGAGGRN